MAGSIEYIFEKGKAIDEVRNILKIANVNIRSEIEINGGKGYKFNCIDTKQYGLILYFNSSSGNSTKLVFENTPENVQQLFIIKNEEKTTENDFDDSSYPCIPIHASIKIQNEEKQKLIYAAIHSAFENIEEDKPTDVIFYKAKIEYGRNKLTLTQYNNGTLLIQGLDSSLVSSIMRIIQSINPISVKENTLLYIPSSEKDKVAEAFDKVPEKFKDLYEEAKKRISEEAFNFLFENDQNTLVSAIGILNIVKKTNIEIPLYNPILYPFAKVFEGFMIRLMIEKCFFTFEAYQKDPEEAKIGNALKGKKFNKYIKDFIRDGNVGEKLRIMWEDLRCNELHSDPAQNPQIINLDQLEQVENRIGEISSSIIDGYKILVKYGYTEAEMLENQAKLTEPKKTVEAKTTEVKDIPDFISHIGTDESGKGDYFGPLVIGGVYVNQEDEEKLAAAGIQDSKKNSDTRNQELAKEIRGILGNDKISVVCIGPEKYNELYEKMKNLNLILAWGHARAIENLLKNNECENAIADQFGDESYISNALMEKGNKISLLQTPKAERDIAVAAASILARDRYLESLNLMQIKLGIKIYKGSSPEVENSAKTLVKKYGSQSLKMCVKMHFKTTERILSNANK